MTYLGMQYQYNQQDSAVYYFKAVYKLSDKIHYVRGMVNGLTLQAGVLSDQNKPDEAILIDSLAIGIATKAHYPKGLAAIYNNIAIPYNNKGDHATSVYYYLKAAALDEGLHDDHNLAMAYANIGGVYNDLKEFNKGYSYSLNGVLLGRSLDHQNAVESGLVNLAGALIELKRYDTSLVVLNDEKDLAIKLNDEGMVISANNDICSLYMRTGKFDLAKKTATELIAFATAAKNNQGICQGWSGLSDYFFNAKDYTKAKAYDEDIIKLAARDHLNAELRAAYQGLATIDLAQKNISGFNYYNDLRDSMDNQSFNDKILKNTQELEAKYSLNKKQAEINDLNKQKKIQQLTLGLLNIMNWVLAFAALVTALIGLLYNRNYRQKKRLLLTKALLQQQRITEFEKEKQLTAAQAVLQGQVEERSRLAKDLHDGLGSILSGAKYSFAHIKDNLTVTPEDSAAYERSMEMLDLSIHELRRVAHNMMPEALMKFGLDAALKDFCNSIDQSGAVKLTYQSFGLNEVPVTEVCAASVYRIVQELVNNILKHAGATTALVQLIRENEVLSITVEDNGRGFDTGILQNNNGIGYLNLKNRVAYLNGTMDVQTAVGRGTSVHIEISIPH